MARLTSDRSGWGSVEDPETGERVPIGEEVDQEVAERLANEYGPVSFDGSDDLDTSDASEDDDEFDAATFVDRTPMDDVVADLETGEYDDRLDAIEAEATRQGVMDAIAERRDD